MVKSARLIISAPSDEDDNDGAADLSPGAEPRVAHLGLESHGKRLDIAVNAIAPEFSRSYLQQLIEAGDVALNGQVTQRCAARVKAGDRIEINLRPSPQSQAFKAEDIALEVVFEDAHILVINKPAGLVVHPAPGNWSGTLMNAILGRDAAAFELPRAGIVHRLDKDTSGLMVVARSRPVMDRLVHAIAEREVRREYLALAQGKWRLSPSMSVEKAIGRDPTNRLRMAVVDLQRHAGKPARTDVQLLSSSAHASLMNCRLHTGRTHQIRVHLSSLGYPIVGDVLYGGRVAAGLERQALHAYRLSFAHPVTGEMMHFSVPLAQDLRDAMDPLGLRYNPDVF